MRSAITRAAVCAGLIGCLLSEAAAYTVRSRDGFFVIELPARPESAEAVEHIPSLPRPGTAFKVEGMRWSAPSWTVTWLRLPIGLVRDDGPANTLQAAIGNQLKQTCAKPASETDIAHQTLRGREIVVAMASEGQGGACTESDTVWRFRILIEEDDYYQIDYRGPRGSERNPEVDRVMASLRIRDAALFVSTFRSDEGRFSIELPGEPERGERAIVIRGKEHDGLGWSVAGPAAKDGIWHVDLLKLPAPPQAGALRRFYDDVTKVEGRCRAILSQKNIRHNGLAGREALIRDTQYTQRHGCGFRRAIKRVRVFVVGNRYYRIEYRTGSDDAMDPEVTRMMDSFRVLN
jgi:hypothetical protein